MDDDVDEEEDADVEEDVDANPAPHLAAADAIEAWFADTLSHAEI